MPPKELLQQYPILDVDLVDAWQQFLNVLIFDRPPAVRVAVAQRLIALSRDITADPTGQQVERMEKDLVETLGITATVIKQWKLDDKMGDLGIDKKSRKEPRSLLWAYYEVQLERLMAACQASAKAPEPAGKGG